MFLVLCVFVIPVRFPVLSCHAVTVAVSQLRQVPRTPRPDWRALLTLQGYRTTLSNRMSASVRLSLCLPLSCLSSFDSQDFVVNHKTMAFLSLARRVAVWRTPKWPSKRFVGILKAKKQQLNWLIEESC